MTAPSDASLALPILCGAAAACKCANQRNWVITAGIGFHRHNNRVAFFSQESTSDPTKAVADMSYLIYLVW